MQRGEEIDLKPPVQGWIARQGGYTAATRTASVKERRDVTLNKRGEHHNVKGVECQRVEVEECKLKIIYFLFLCIQLFLCCKISVCVFFSHTNPLTQPYF